MSGGASATGQRRCPQGLEDATNKKKQKDRVNQESKDGEPKRGGSQMWEILLMGFFSLSQMQAISGIAIGSVWCFRKPMGASVILSLAELLLDWKQNADEVIVKLHVGSGPLRIEEIDAAFTDTDCVVQLPDGRQWSCIFYEEIESSCSKVQARKGGVLQLLLHKKIPLRTWPSLLVKENQDPSLENTLEGEKIPHQNELACPALPQGREEDQNKEEAAAATLETTAEEPEPMVNLTFMKNDSYEKGPDSVVVHVYVKEICRKTSRVLFREQDFTLVFQTSDVNFLRLHPDCGPHTIFRWQVKLRNMIQPEQCVYHFTSSRIDICLRKRQSQRWGGLEAPATRVGGAKVAMPTGPTPLDAAPPGGSPLASQEEARVGEKEKVKARTEESGLDSVAARTPPEHVALKPEPPLTSPKPTCMVPPMPHSPMSSESVEEEEEEEKKVCLPGFTGLVNLGNTCFMNSVIQSLSNTRELRDYFHDRSFEAEINYSNPLGTGGRLAIGFAVLLRALWKGTHHAFQPSKLKAIVASKASQFTGYAQHDAQEFMAFLLDGLHEDLNRIQNKPYTETVDSDGRPDEVVAQEAWQRHKMRNDSFIVDLFHGQYKSKLVCPVCSKVSITFDPFLYLPVPLPQKQKVLTVYYFAKEPHKKPVKFLVSISKENSSAMEVLDSLAQSVHVKPESLRLAEVIKNRFHRVFLPSHSLDTVSPTDLLLCFEVLSPELAKERVVVLQVQQRPQVPSIPIAKCAACQKKQQSEDEKLKRCTRCYRVGYCNQVCQKTHWPDHKGLCRPENIGFPFFISVPESRLTYARLAQLLEGYARYSVSVFQPPFQLGRVSPEQSPQVPSSSTPPVPSTLEAGGGDQDLRPSPESQVSPTVAELGDTGASRNRALPDRGSVPNLDTGLSESTVNMPSEGGFSKECAGERLLRPEAAVPGYQHPAEVLSAHPPPFFINKIDATNKEQKLEDKGEAPLELGDDCSLALVWKNNERLKEFVLVGSKELECVEDPGSASEAARAGHFTLEQCLNLFTKPEVLAPEEACKCFEGRSFLWAGLPKEPHTFHPSFHECVQSRRLAGRPEGHLTCYRQPCGQRKNGKFLII
uniref:ubiquitinyl hydrolase 1 n=1 Tax=Vombatus ursinus TaxID=29139 RepID=A0A4X2LSU7_VOMUR